MKITKLKFETDFPIDFFLALNTCPRNKEERYMWAINFAKEWGLEVHSGMTVGLGDARDQVFEPIFASGGNEDDLAVLGLHVELVAQRHVELLHDGGRQANRAAVAPFLDFDVHGGSK